MTADPTQLRKVDEYSSKEIAFCISRAPEPERYFYGSSDFHVYEFDTNTEKPESVPLNGLPHESYVQGIATVADLVVSAGFDGKLIWWDSATRERRRAVQAHERWIRALAASPDGQFLVTVADDMHCKVWNAQTGELIRTHEDHAKTTPHHFPSMLYAVAVSPDGRLIATGDRTGHVVIRELGGGEKVGELEAPGMYTWDPKARIHSIGGIRSLAFSPDTTLLAVGGMGEVGNIDHLGGKSRVEVFAWQKSERILELENEKHKGLVERIAFHDTGEWFIAAGGDNGGFVSIFGTEDGKTLAQEQAPGHVHDLAWSNDGVSFLTVGHGKVAKWQL